VPFEATIPPLAAHASLQMRTAVMLPIHAEAVLEWRSGRDGQRTDLTVSGRLHLPELRAEIVLCGPAQDGSGPRVERRQVVPLIGAGATIAVRRQSLASPDGATSDVWVLTAAPGNDPPWREHYTGKLEGESFTFDQHIVVQGMLEVAFVPGVSGGGVSTIELDGALCFDRRVPLPVLFRGTARSARESSDADGETVVLIGAGTSIPIARHTLWGPAAAGTQLSVRVTGPERNVSNVTASPVAAAARLA
jgi:hypothetical protein